MDVAEKKFPADLKTVYIKSSVDSNMQPALFYNPENSKDEARPLLVALHTWSSHYDNHGAVPYYKWSKEKKWVMIHPEFRGRNSTPQATGSELAVSDILDAVEYAKTQANIDTDRIYLCGVSGGGYYSLLMAGRHPEIWAAVSAWVPISDLRKWYNQCEKNERFKIYAENISDSCGGAPGAGKVVDDEYRKRSPLTYLGDGKVKKLPLDINTGIHDGHSGSVPVSHALEAYNMVAQPQDIIAAEDITYIVEKEAVPSHIKDPDLKDELYGNFPPLLRKVSDNVRITVFEGGHQIVHNAALHWLEKQQKGERALWKVSGTSDVRFSDKETEAAK